MKIYLAQNVYDAALARIGRLFDEFDQVIVDFSGGKDSTVLLNLTLQVAADRGRLPVPVLFVDQEAEWQTAIDYIRTVMHDPRVDPYWMQMPIRLSNGTSEDQDWLYCWREGDDWIRPKEPDSIHENVYGTLSFLDLFQKIVAHHWPDQTVAQLGGVRCQESPGRTVGLTAHACYKEITWGNRAAGNGRHFTFYPLYDWSYTDIWKAIHDHNWAYCDLYNLMYQHGIPVAKMRVSNVHHETALKGLPFMQELEPATWNAVTRRLASTNAVARQAELFDVPAELPYMFRTWREYRDHLLANLIQDEAKRAKFGRQFAAADRDVPPALELDLLQVEIAAILVNDHWGIKLGNFLSAHRMELRTAGRRSAWLQPPAPAEASARTPDEPFAKRVTT